MAIDVHAKTGTQMFIVALVLKVKNWSPPKCAPTDKWINKSGTSYNGVFIHLKE
jgi:hypothetical protein